MKTAFKWSPFDWPAALTSYAGKGCDKESSENLLYKGWVRIPILSCIIPANSSFEKERFAKRVSKASRVGWFDVRIEVSRSARVERINDRRTRFQAIQSLSFARSSRDVHCFFSLGFGFSRVVRLGLKIFDRYREFSGRSSVSIYWRLLTSSTGFSVTAVFLTRHKAAFTDLSSNKSSRQGWWPKPFIGQSQTLFEFEYALELGEDLSC